VSIYQRYELNLDPPAFIREFQVFNLTGGLHGAGRMGGDLWPVLANKKGERSGLVYARYPENNWRNLDMHDWILAPGPDGAVATARLEGLREGVQECEARIVLEDVLLDAGKKAKLGAELAQRCQEALDEHHRAMWKTIWTHDQDLKSIGHAWYPGMHPGIRRSPLECLCAIFEKNGKGVRLFSDRRMTAEEARKGQEWFAQGWQEREKKLFILAGEVAAKLGMK
jgi:hypothetical protein